MNARALLEQLTKEDVRLFLEGERLRLVYPKGWGTPERLNMIKPYKPELIHLLKTRPKTLVWSVVVDGRNVTVIDPHLHSQASMRRAIEGQFGVARVGGLRLLRGF